MGEIGLTGEVRSIMHLESRILEAQRLGFRTCVVPHAANKLKNFQPDGLDIRFIKNLDEAFGLIF